VIAYAPQISARKDFKEIILSAIAAILEELDRMTQQITSSGVDVKRK